MYTLSFHCNGNRIFNLDRKNYPLPRIGDIVTYHLNNYKVESVRHRFADIKGAESTGIVINMIEID